MIERKERMISTSSWALEKLGRAGSGLSYWHCMAAIEHERGNVLAEGDQCDNCLPILLLFQSASSLLRSESILFLPLTIIFGSFSLPTSCLSPLTPRNSNNQPIEAATTVCCASCLKYPTNPAVQSLGTVAQVAKSRAKEIQLQKRRGRRIAPFSPVQPRRG